MTLEEAIKYVKEVVIKNRKVQYFYENNPTVWNDGGERMIRCKMRADVGEQLVQWLEKLQQIEQSYEGLKSKIDSSDFPDDVLDFLSSLRREERN